MKQNKPQNKSGGRCDYEGCSEPMIATENLTGMKGRLCIHHFRRVFGKVIDRAEIDYEK